MPKLIYIPSLYNVCRETAEALFGTEDVEQLDAAIVLLASYQVGHHAIRISQVTGIDRQFCVWVGMRMRHSGRWKEQIYKDWLEKESGDILFVIDALIAVGDVSGYTPKDGKWRVRLGSSMGRVGYVEAA